VIILRSLPSGSRWIVEPGAFLEEGSQVVDNSKSRGNTLQEHKRWLVKAARMYAMCRKAGVAEPLDVTGLAVAAFEDMPLEQALVFVRSNEQNIEDLAWAFRNSSSAEEFEQRVKEIKYLPYRGENPPA
jgi:hypothetical protein